MLCESQGLPGDKVYQACVLHALSQSQVVVILPCPKTIFPLCCILYFWRIFIACFIFFIFCLFFKSYQQIDCQISSILANPPCLARTFVSRLHLTHIYVSVKQLTSVEQWSVYQPTTSRLLLLQLSHWAAAAPLNLSSCRSIMCHQLRPKCVTCSE